MMEMWKWNLAFQCVVNIGVRGSESVRTRVVEADMVPVIATILDNYIKATEKAREEDAEPRRNSNAQRHISKASVRLSRNGPTRLTSMEWHHQPLENRTTRRQAPPTFLEIPIPFSQQALSVPQQQPSDNVTEQTPPPQMTLTYAQDQVLPQQLQPPQAHQNQHHHRRRSQDLRPHSSRRNSLIGAVPSMDVADGFGPRTVRENDRLPTMIPALQNGINSQPESPTTPNAPITRPLNIGPPERRRPSLRQQQSHSGDSDEGGNDVTSEHSNASVVVGDEPMIDIQSNVDIEGGDGTTGMLDAVATPLDLEAPARPEGNEIETFNITHRAGLDGSIINTNMNTGADTTTTIGIQPPAPPMHVLGGGTTNSQPTHGRYLLERTSPPGVLAATPRDEDVLMSLQLLAYVSKYCNLRTYFQKSHLVPKLKIDYQLRLLGEGSLTGSRFHFDGFDEEEYLLPDDFNIFPLVEKFTVRHHSQDMQYWAGVVMRNLCRKDDSRGGIRQCAYYECGKWEEWTRQFAKCRRCRRTKYCSKDCQKNAWVYHRHWCQVASS